MQKAVIVSAVRTAVGRSPKGSLKDTRPEDMAAAVLNELLKRCPGLDPIDIDDIIMGCTFPEAEQGLNLGRVLVAKAGLPHQVPGMTLNRFCSSGLQAISMACERIMCGMADVIIAGGVESMSLVPMGGFGFNPDPQIMADRPWTYESMGITAENLASKYDISRERQDRFALLSHEQAISAIDSGRFKEQIVPLKVLKQRKNSNGQYELDEEVFDFDEGPRANTTMERLARLRPAFKSGGSATAGNSSQMSDGAAAVLCMSEKTAREYGIKPMIAYRSFAVAGVDPRYMCAGPVAAVPKALQLSKLKLDDIGLVELNEAFASQALYCIEALGLHIDITNVNGGAIALGHPWAALVLSLRFNWPMKCTNLV